MRMDCFIACCAGDTDTRVCRFIPIRLCRFMLNLQRAGQQMCTDEDRDDSNLSTPRAPGNHNEPLKFKTVDTAFEEEGLTHSMHSRGDGQILMDIIEVSYPMIERLHCS